MNDKLKESISALKDDDLTIVGITDPAEWERIALNLGLHVSEALKSVYSMTNGFSNYHQGSQIFLWSMQKIIANREDWCDPVVRIGDFLLESDYVIVPMTTETPLVKMQYDDRTLSLSLVEFISDLSRGKFNFM